MNFEIVDHELYEISSDALVVFAQFSKNKDTEVVPSAGCKSLDKVLEKQIATTAQVDQFKAKRGEVLAIQPKKNLLATRVFVLGLGDEKEFTAQVLRRALASFVSKMHGKIDSISLSFPADLHLTPLEFGLVTSEAVLLGNYRYTKYKSENENERVLSSILIAEKDNTIAKEIKSGIMKGKIRADATILARDLVNEPGIDMNPTALAKVALDLSKGNPDISCTIFGRDECKKMGMNAFLGIAQAADTEPKFIYLHYKPKKSSKEKLALVGKGITFDTGGINLKPGNYMSTMKEDMAGAAVVLAVFSVLSQIKPDFEVIGCIAATPNLISGRSIVPGDVVRAMNGKTIEVMNTDAEGRVTLADSLSFAVTKKATKIIDIATLTGACMVALGTEISGLMSNNRELTEKLLAAAKNAGEKLWELPLEESYKELNKSEVADISNLPAGMYGGAIAAGLFLQEFIDNKPWVHLDIAGPAFLEKPHDLGPKGATGHIVRTLLTLLEEGI